MLEEKSTVIWSFTKSDLKGVHVKIWTSNGYKTRIRCLIEPNFLSNLIFFISMQKIPRTAVGLIVLRLSGFNHI